MAIDASIAAGAPTNLLQSLMGATQLKGAMLQQQQLQQQMGANKAISAAYQQATDPATGQVDQNKLLGLISQDPNAAYNMPQVQSQILEQRNKALEFDKNKFDLALKQNTYFKNQFAPLANAENVSLEDLARIGAGAVKDGLLPAEQIVQAMRDIPNDPAGRKQWVQNFYMQSLDNDAQLKLMLPQTQVLNNGATQNVVAIDPRTGQPRVTGTIQNTMSPGEAATPIQVFNPAAGAMENITKQQFANGSAPGGAQMPVGGGQGRYPGAGGQGQPMQPQTFQAGPALGQSAAAETVGKGSGEQVMALQAQAEGSPQRVYFLQDMMAQLPKFDSGPTADWTAKANALALQLAPGMAAKAGIDPQSVASKEEFSKFATNLAINTSAGLGAGTDSKLATAVAGNPNSSLSKLGNEQIMKVLIGTERATQAKNQAWQSAGVDPSQYGKWSAQWNKDIDPRVFVTPELTQEERSKMYNGLKPADQKKFLDSYRTAIDAGIIQRPAKE